MNKIQEMMAERKVGTKIDKKELILQMRSHIEKAVSAVFDSLPFVNVIGIHGYAPHFNDGDVCKWGIEVQVDWLGEAYYAPLYQESEEFNGEEDLSNSKYVKLLSEKTPGYAALKNHPNYQNLSEASALLYSFKKEFEIWDNDHNGTWWMFIRKPAAIGNPTPFEIETGNFEHD